MEGLKLEPFADNINRPLCSIESKSPVKAYEDQGHMRRSNRQKLKYCWYANFVDILNKGEYLRNFDLFMRLPIKTHVSQVLVANNANNFDT